jgi:hypothetical protein
MNDGWRISHAVISGLEDAGLMPNGLAVPSTPASLHRGLFSKPIKGSSWCWVLLRPHAHAPTLSGSAALS